MENFVPISWPEADLFYLQDPIGYLRFDIEICLGFRISCLEFLLMLSGLPDELLKSQFNLGYMIEHVIDNFIA